MFNRWFLDHPRSVGESYLEHQRNAFWFAARLFGASVASFVHGVIPGTFVHTGSTAVLSLYDRMIVNRQKRGLAQPLPPSSSQ